MAPCAAPATWLSGPSLRCHQHDDEHYRRCWVSRYTHPEEEEVILAAIIAFRRTIMDVRWAFQEERKGSPTAESIARTGT